MPRYLPGFESGYPKINPNTFNAGGFINPTVNSCGATMIPKFNKVVVEKDMSMEELYHLARTGTELQKTPAKISQLDKEIHTVEIDAYLNSLFSSETPKVARMKAIAAAAKKIEMSKNREIYKYDKNVVVDDFDKKTATSAVKKKNEKEYTYREYVEAPKEKSKCIFKRIFEFIFGKDKEKQKDECVKLRF